MKTNFYLRDPQSYEDEDTNKRVFKSNNKTAIILFASYGNGRLKYYTGDHVKPTGWDFEKQSCKKNVEINTRLTSIVTAINKVYNSLIEKGKRVTNTNLKNALLVELKRDNEPENTNPESTPITTLYGLLERFIEARKGLRAKGTMQRYQALSTHLLNYERKNKVVNLSDINAEFGDAFASYLYSLGHQKNTVGKLFIGLKVLLNWGVSSGYSLPMHYKKFSIPSAPTKIIALTETEFFQFETVALPKDEEVTRDLFCFSAYTGLRFSDVVRITPEMIEGDFLNITTKKTEHKLKVYLLPEAKTILARYKNRFKGLRTNQGANKGVKKIARLAGINEPVKVTTYFGNKSVDKTVKKYQVLSFHSAKKTNVTLSLKNGVRPEVLSDQIGNTMRTLKPYIAIADEDKANEIGKAFKNIKKVASKLRIA